MNTATKTTNDDTKNSATMSKAKHRKMPARSLQFDPSRGRPLKSAAEAEAAIRKNHKEASKSAKRGWATRRRREREIDAAAADAAARDSR